MTSQENYDNQTNVCYVKQAYTENFIYLEYQSITTVEDFIKQIKKPFEQIMNVSSDKLELVEAGQETEKSEEGIKMEPENITMYQKYGGQLKNKAFYVRYVREPH